jgi:hypothetical protein
MSSADRLVIVERLAFTCQTIKPPANNTATAAAIQALVVEVKIIFLSKKPTC